MSDSLGILLIGVQLYCAFRWLVPDDGSRTILGFVAFIVLTGLALYFWHKDPPFEHLSSSGEWALAILGSIFIGGMSFAIDVAIGLSNNPKLSPVQAATKAGGPFGFALTVMICPGFTMLAVAGLLRALVLQSDITPPNQS